MNSPGNNKKFCGTAGIEKSGAREYIVQKFCDAQFVQECDSLSVEEPLEIRISNKRIGENYQLSVTMRTPGNDAELAAGFLFTEGIISGLNDIEDVAVGKCNVVNVRLCDSLSIEKSKMDRHSYVASSCGVCGKKSIDAVKVAQRFEIAEDQPRISPALIQSLPKRLRELQADFDKTGGVHASLLVNNEGKVLGLMEDVGRHNALDKVIGEQLLLGYLPLSHAILLVSGRASFELVQKAAQAGIPVLLAIGAPSSLAVELAISSKMTLVGFLRDGRFNVYAGAHRVLPG